VTPPVRQPPPVVPTLTDVVPHLSDAVAPRVGDGQPLAGEASAVVVSRGVSEPDPVLVDELTDRVMAALLPRLQARYAEALQAWVLAQLETGARTIADAVRDEIAQDVRRAIVSALGTTRR